LGERELSHLLSFVAQGNFFMPAAKASSFCPEFSAKGLPQNELYKHKLVGSSKAEHIVLIINKKL
jgi:hypothetical protein